MTRAERAVIDAARALAAKLESRPVWEAEDAALVRAVRALPRPLSEQLAELRPGAVVWDDDGVELCVLDVDHERGEYVWKCKRLDGETAAGVAPLSDIRRVISNPEAPDGR